MDISDFNLQKKGCVILWGEQPIIYLRNRYLYPILEKFNLLTYFPRRYEKFNCPKILITGIRYFEAFFDRDNEYLSTKSTIVVTGKTTDLAWLVSILNSKFIRFYININYLSSSMGGGINFTPDLVRELPLTIPDEQMQGSLSHLGTIIAQKLQTLNELSSRFRTLISPEFNIENWPTKLEKWWNFDFKTFANLLKVKLSLSEKDELFSLFEKYRVQCSHLDIEIRQIDQSIDQLVYKLYNLTQQEIKLVEEE